MHDDDGVADKIVIVQQRQKNGRFFQGSTYCGVMPVKEKGVVT